MELPDPDTQSLACHAEALDSELPGKIKTPAKVLEGRTVMRLGDIQKEHRLARDLERELELPFFAEPPRECVPAAWVFALLERMPLVVRQDRGEGVACVGNIRLYRLARVVLNADDMVPVHRDIGSLTAGRKERLREGLLAETFLLPAIFRRRAGEIQALEAGWARIPAPVPMKHTEVDIARLYREETGRSRQGRHRA